MSGTSRRRVLLVAAVAVLAVAALSASRPGPDHEPASADSPEAGLEMPTSWAEENEAAESLLASVDPVSEERSGEVASVAAEVVEAYGGRGDCVLAQSGYLDLAGNVWSCLAYGGDWAEVCVVAGERDGEKCEVRTWRMGSEEVEAALL